MLCDICHNKEAKIFYTEIINGKKKEQHLCEDCAAEYAVTLKDKKGNEIPIGNILSGIFSNYAKGMLAKQTTEQVCSNCGMSVSEFLKIGRLGCAECYNAFSMIIDKNLKTIQGADSHDGKTPDNAVRIKEKAPQEEPAESDDETTKIFKEAVEKASKKAAAVKKGSVQDKEDVQSKENVQSKESTQSKDNAQSKESAQSKDNALSKECLKLRDELAKALEREDYEKAAKLRDKIKACEGSVNVQDSDNRKKVLENNKAKPEESGNKEVNEKKLPEKKSGNKEVNEKELADKESEKKPRGRKSKEAADGKKDQ